MEAKLILKKTSTGFYLWRNPLDKSQELLGATVPIMNDNGVDLREYILSLKNCQVIEHGYDLDELAKSEAIKISETEVIDEKLKRIYKRGFQKALEILGDKKFSEEDMRKAYTTGWNSCNNFTGYDENQEFIELPDCIQSLQQTEWDVEIEMETPGATYGHSGWHKEPKLDAEGCLILKRKV